MQERIGHSRRWYGSGLLALGLLGGLLLLGSSTAQGLRSLLIVTESRQPMGMNLPPYRMDTGQPIDEFIIGNLAQLGVKWMRFEFRAKGNPPLIPIDNYRQSIALLREHGLHVLGLVDYTTVPAPQSTWSTTQYRDQFAATVAWLATEFQGDVDAWEIWNEEDIGYDPATSTGGDTFLSPRDFAYLLGGDPTAERETFPWAADGVYQAIKAVDPADTVLLGGLSNAWKAPDGRGAGHYMEAVYQELDGLGYIAGTWPFDVVAVHPYYGLNPDPDVYLFSQGDYILRSNIWSTMEAHGDGDKRIWITEIGWNTNTIQWVCMPPKVTEAQQAAYLRTSWDIFLGEATSLGEVLVDKVFWFQYQDKGMWVDPDECPVAESAQAYQEAIDRYTRIRPPLVTPVPGIDEPRGDPVVIDTWWGVVHGDYVPKPSYYAYRDYRGPYRLYVPLLMSDSAES
jgi:hypothetical protein